MIKLNQFLVKIYKKILFILFLFLISACSSIPKNTSNSCAIFSERYLWYKYAKKTEEKWGTPIYIQLAIIKMESDFDWLAKPARKKIFKIIPFKRPSSSFGYSQAVKGTWNNIKMKLEINQQEEQGLKTALILLVGTQTKQSLF